MVMVMVTMVTMGPMGLTMTAITRRDSESIIMTITITVRTKSMIRK